MIATFCVVGAVIVFYLGFCLGFYLGAKGMANKLLEAKKGDKPADIFKDIEKNGDIQKLRKDEMGPMLEDF